MSRLLHFLLRRYPSAECAENVPVVVNASDLANLLLCCSYVKGKVWRMCRTNCLDNLMSEYSLSPQFKYNVFTLGEQLCARGGGWGQGIKHNGISDAKDSRVKCWKLCLNKHLRKHWEQKNVRHKFLQCWLQANCHLLLFSTPRHKLVHVYKSLALQSACFHSLW